MEFDWGDSRFYHPLKPLSCRAMAIDETSPKHTDYVAPMSIGELEAGLRVMKSHGCDHDAFWDEHATAFRQTLLLAIRDTSDSLLSPTISQAWRQELSGQLKALFDALQLTEVHALTCSPPTWRERH